MGNRKNHESSQTDDVEARSAAAVLDDLESMRGRAVSAEQQRDEYLNLLRRTQADFENYQKRIQRDLAEQRSYAHAVLARELLPVVDNLQRASRAAQEENQRNPLAEGVGLVESQLLDILSRFGVTPTGAVGEPFDPDKHEAVRTARGTNMAPGNVVEILEPGYRVHARVLRPAKVAVSAPDADE